ncbi:MAG: hypothetical protein ACD_3C00168G0001 [uncultured bacterium (gcode 4)]|uniref:Uncharacterized protein n=1 Tax=uncultured bacterium (gcode 4) TaxID=1234023 RepID=K2GWJ8_9BACT|nr:MAG: hypothetical protein ACD_3C00168G0001 [uncultured bacterium (gcode 4)]
MKKSFLLTWIILILVSFFDQLFAFGFDNPENYQDNYNRNTLKYRRPVYPPNPDPSIPYPYPYPDYCRSRFPYNMNCYNRWYDNFPISEFYKKVTSLWDWTIIKITTNNQDIVSTMQSTIYRSISNVFKNQPVSINITYLWNWAQAVIKVSPSDNWTYRAWNNRTNSYMTVDSSVLIRTIQHFANTAMPIINVDGTVNWWR